MHSGEAFIFGTLLCSFVTAGLYQEGRKDPRRARPYPVRLVTEYLNNFYKNNAQQDLQRETASRTRALLSEAPLLLRLGVHPGFSDSRAVPFSATINNRLDAFIREKTSESSPNASLPSRLQDRAGNRYLSC
jgi:hypothetical protein